MGRTRLDASLVGEIAAALEEDEHQGAAWARRARRARPRQEPELPPSSETQQPASPPEAPAAADSGPEQATSPLPSDENSEQASAAQTPPAAAPSSPQVRRRWVVPIMLVGPETSLALMPVNIAGALVWGYGARRWGMTRTPARGLPTLGAALTGNLFTFVADKLISGVIALAAVTPLPAARPEQPPTAETMQPGTSHKEYAPQTAGYGR